MKINVVGEIAKPGIYHVVGNRCRDCKRYYNQPDVFCREKQQNIADTRSKHFPYRYFFSLSVDDKRYKAIQAKTADHQEND